MNLKRLLNTHLGRIFISIILGFGLATLFRKVCNEKNCINFSGPIISDIEDKIYEHSNKCYTYKLKSDNCDNSKKIVKIDSLHVNNEFV